MKNKIILITLSLFVFSICGVIRAEELQQIENIPINYLEEPENLLKSIRDNYKEKISMFGMNYAPTQQYINIKNIVVLVKFPDRINIEMVKADSLTNLGTLYNSIGSSRISLKEYISKISYNKITVDSEF